MSIVVTGATGQLGRLIVESLIARGTAPSDIVAAGRKVEKLADLAERGVRIAAIDYTQPATLREAFAGADVLVLVSGSEIGQRALQHANAITAAKEAGVGRIVYTSIANARTTTNILAPEHKATEEALEASGVATTILGNGWYTENYIGTLDQAAATGSILSSTDGGKVASASRVDYAEAAAVVASQDGHAGKVYVLTGDVAWDFDQFAAAASDVLGKEITHTSVSSDEHAAALAGAGLDEGTVGFLVGLDDSIRQGTLSATPGDLSALIGRPTTPLREGLLATR